MKHIIYVLWVLLLTSCSVDAQEIVEPERRDEVIVENNVFKVWYSEVKVGWQVQFHKSFVPPHRLTQASKSNCSALYPLTRQAR